MSRWFRHYAGMMRDEKLVSVAVRSKQPVERVVWVWGAILESAAEINDGGRYDFDAGEAAYFLRCSEDELASIISGLQSLGRVHDGFITKWSDRQYDSDGSKERQRRYRERQKAGRNVSGRGSDVASEKGDVTRPSRDGEVTLQETDTELSEPSGSGAASPADPRQQLWSEGVTILKAITGKTEGAAKQLVGMWCKSAKDDCALVLSKIRAAQAERIGNPAPWITAALKPPDKTPKKPTLASMWTEEAKALGIIDEPASQQDRRLGASLPGGHDQGADFARRIASA